MLVPTTSAVRPVFDRWQIASLALYQRMLDDGSSYHHLQSETRSLTEVEETSMVGSSRPELSLVQLSVEAQSGNIQRSKSFHLRTAATKARLQLVESPIGPAQTSEMPNRPSSHSAPEDRSGEGSYSCVW